MKIISYIFIATLLLGALVFDYWKDFKKQAIRSVRAQEPRRWRSGDTTWYEIDSIPALPSVRDKDSLHILWDSTHETWYPPMMLDNVHQQTFTLPPTSKFTYRLPYWNIYRRSFTHWGITFSTGQANPYNPYPASNDLDATVTSHPLNRPR